MSEWIDVKDRLPDAEMTVLVALQGCDEPVWLGWHDGDAEWHTVDGEGDVDVTHWQEIPVPPPQRLHSEE